MSGELLGGKDGGNRLVFAVLVEGKEVSWIRLCSVCLLVAPKALAS